MKRCPECRRDYYDDSLRYCLDDGTALLDGPRELNEPPTVIFSAPSQESARDTSTEAGVTDLPSSAGKYRDLDKIGVPKSRTRTYFLVAIPLAVLLLFGAYFVYKDLSPTSAKSIDSVAVMPFVNEAGNPDLEYLSDGMTETLLNNLSQIPNLNVKARSSVFRYKGKDVDAQTIGKELGVDAI